MKYCGIMRFTKGDNKEHQMVKTFYSPEFIVKYQNNVFVKR